MSIPRHGLPITAFTSEPGSGLERAQVDPGEASYFEGRQWRISYEYTVTATPVVIKFSSPRGFTLHFQDVECDQGGFVLHGPGASEG